MDGFEKVIASMVDVNRMLVELSEKVDRIGSDMSAKIDRIDASLGAVRVMGSKAGVAGRPSRYEWGALYKDGKFFTPCEKGERDRLVNSLTAGANKRFGKGKVRVRKVGAGVWVIRKGDWSETL